MSPPTSSNNLLFCFVFLYWVARLWGPREGGLFVGCVSFLRERMSQLGVVLKDGEWWYGA